MVVGVVERVVGGCCDGYSLWVLVEPLSQSQSQSAREREREFFFIFNFFCYFMHKYDRNILVISLALLTLSSGKRESKFLKL